VFVAVSILSGAMKAGNYWLAKSLLASQERGCSVELVNYFGVLDTFVKIQCTTETQEMGMNRALFL
jgi:hypothetical protein